MASFARTWLGDGRTPRLPSQDIGAPFSRCYPPVNHPQVPGGCPLTTRSLALSLSLYLTLSFTFSSLSLSLGAAYSQPRVFGVDSVKYPCPLSGWRNRSTLVSSDTRASPRGSKIQVAGGSATNSSSGRRTTTSQTRPSLTSNLIVSL